MKTRVLALVLGVAAGAAGPAQAHHSFAMYERGKTLTLTGTIKEFGWTSPHVSIQVIPDNASPSVPWFIEASSPSVLARGGWTSTLLKPGDKVSIGIHPRRDGAAGGLLADEQQLLVNGHPAKGVLWLQPPGAPSCDR